MEKATEEEITQAVDFLRLPTWSRGYKGCHSPESEITCEQVVLAYRTIKTWEDRIRATSVEQRKWFVLDHPVKGIGNKMGTDVPAFLIALMQGRALVVRSNHPLTQGGVRYEHVYGFPDVVATSLKDLPPKVQERAKQARAVPQGREWSCFDLRALENESFVGFSDLLYASMVYVNEQTAAFARAHFGMHAAHFISNYFSRLGESSRAEALEILNKTQNPVLGVHARYHRAGQYYSRGFNQTLPTLYEEIDRRRRVRPNLHIALATDNLELFRKLKERYGELIINSEALRRPDKDHFSAMIDMQLVMGSDELLLTYRSTFSWVIAARVGQPAWWIEKEALHCWPVSGSQGGGISMVYHWRDHCDWRTNDRVEFCGAGHRGTLDLFFRHLAL